MTSTRRSVERTTLIAPRMFFTRTSAPRSAGADHAKASDVWVCCAPASALCATRRTSAVRTGAAAMPLLTVESFGWLSGRREEGGGRTEKLGGRDLSLFCLSSSLLPPPSFLLPPPSQLHVIPDRHD